MGLHFFNSLRLGEVVAMSAIIDFHSLFKPALCFLFLEQISLKGSHTLPSSESSSIPKVAASEAFFVCGCGGAAILGIVIGSKPSFVANITLIRSAVSLAEATASSVGCTSSGLTGLSSCLLEFLSWASPNLAALEAPTELETLASPWSSHFLFLGTC